MNRNLVGIILGRFTNQKQEWPVVAMFINGSEDDLPRMLPTKFRCSWQSGFREEDFLEINQAK
jgi:hypothetical protein